MIEIIDPDAPLTRDDDESVAQLTNAVRDLRSEAATLVEFLDGRKRLHALVDTATRQPVRKPAA